MGSRKGNRQNIRKSIRRRGGEVYDERRSEAARSKFRRFREEWRRDFPWVVVESRGNGIKAMRCAVCLQARAKSEWTTGVCTLKRDALNRHSISTVHNDSLRLFRQQVIHSF